MQFRDNEIKLIAEIGGNHEGDFDYAVKLIELASESNVEAIKFQIYSGETLVNKDIDPSRKQHFDKFSFTDDQYIELAEKCISLDVNFNASIWNIRQIDLFDDYLSFYKIGSGDLTAFPIIEHLALKGKPMIISTGLSVIEEIIETIDFICNVNPVYKDTNMICIMHCTSSYPAPDNDINLNAIRFLQSTFDYPIGFSNHSTNTRILEYAIALGAKIIEFHFTDKREGKDFRDHKVSLTKNDVIALKEKIPFILDALGHQEKKPTNSEIASNHTYSFRRGSFPARNIRKGEVVSLKDFVFLRPAEGISAKDIYSYIGKRANKDLKALAVLSPNDFEDK